MPPDDRGHRLDQARRELNETVDRLAASVLDLDEDRHNCLRLAEHFEDLSQRVADQYPSLAGPAKRLGELFTDLDSVLGRLSSSTEELTASAGRLADEAAGFRSPS
jgi:ABC-type transporter Mla subunit MlaD